MYKILLLALFIVSGVELNAQRYGHMNFSAFLTSLTDTRKADIDLEEYQNTLVAQGQAMAEKFKNNYIAFMKEQQAGNLAPIKEKEQQELLQKEQEAIQAFEQEIQQKLQVKREELLKPIVDKITAKISEVCKENGFVMVFDTSSFNALLYSPESEDITSLVRSKMIAVPATK
ncbi:MAG: OmpH family outer membrane protein [Bacteroidetes bacterium]|jgi:outer membrane protein|nr:OmpH family outer membrane protein [Bacteroidota bacterium]